MAAIIATPTDAPRNRTGRRYRAHAAAAVRAVRQAAQAVSTARPSLSPVLTVAGLSSGVISAWETFGRGAAWGALAVAFFLFDLSRD